MSSFRWLVLSTFTFLSLIVLGRAAPYPFVPPFQAVLDDDSFKDLLGIVEALRHAEVVPDVLPTKFFPTVSVLPIYYNATSHQTVDLGNTIPISLTSTQPAFAIRPLNEHLLAGMPTRALAANKTLTIVLSDPDATSRADPVKGQMCHWIATNIQVPVQVPVTEDEDAWLPHNVDNGLRTKPHENNRYKFRTVVDYMQPAPPPKTGKHRYIFVVLAPKHGGGEDPDVVEPRERPHFGYGKVGKGVMDWAKDNELVPIGANFFYAENEEQ